MKDLNMFYLNKDPSIAAQCHADVDLLEQGFNSARILCTVQRDYISRIEADEKKMYIDAMPGFVSPLREWLRKRKLQYLWGAKHFEALVNEYEYRFEKEHPSKHLVPFLSIVPETIALSERKQHEIRLHMMRLDRGRVIGGPIPTPVPTKFKYKFTPPPYLLDDKFSRDHNNNKREIERHREYQPHSSLNSYRAFYIDKDTSYTKRDRPSWLPAYVTETVPSPIRRTRPVGLTF